MGSELLWAPLSDNASALDLAWVSVMQLGSLSDNASALDLAWASATSLDSLLDHV